MGLCFSVVGIICIYGLIQVRLKGLLIMNYCVIICENC